MKKELLLGIVSLFVFGSCTVLEDRSICPCWLKVSYAECRDYSGDALYHIWNNDEFHSSGTESLTGGPYMHETPRGPVSHSSVFGIMESEVVNSVYVVPFGQETVEIYGSRHLDIDMSTDFVATSVKPNKQFCNVLVRISEDISGYYQDLECKISSTSAGLDLKTLNAVKGEFEIVKYPSRDGQFFFRLLRQGFDDLELKVSDKGLLLNKYDLSKLIAMNGYNWKDENLKDMTIIISLSSNDVLFEFSDWIDGGEFTPEL